MFRKLLACSAILIFSQFSIANANDKSGSFANIDVEYYDNGYLKEESVERLRVTQI